MATALRTQVLSRRSFLITVGGLGVGVAFDAFSADAYDAAVKAALKGNFSANAWVTIAADGTVAIISPGAEMGQGVMTSMPILVAEEMDADWSKVRIVQAPADALKYGNPQFNGAQITAGSRTTTGYYEKLRLAGAQTRKVILASAADMLQVPATELKTELGKVVHLKSGRSIGFGDVAKSGKLPQPLPQATKDDLKPAAQWRYIGNPRLHRVDVPSKIDGTAKFGIDIQLPEMLYGAVLRAPVQGEGPVRIDSKAAESVKGILRVVPLPYGVGVVGETVEATIKAKDLLQVTWTTASRVRGYSSDRILEDYRMIGRDYEKMGVDMVRVGDVPAAIARADKVIAVDYLSDHVHHATMEPMNATAVVSAGGVEVWVPTQSPSITQGFAARTAGVTPDKVQVHTTLSGGGFGRRSEADFVVDAVLLAKAVQSRPVKVIWSRSDDIRHGKYRPLTAQHIQIGLDAQGDMIAWRHRIVSQSLFARVFPELFAAAGGRDRTATEGAEHNYHVPAHAVEFIRQDRGQDVGFWRAISAGYTKFAVECIIDEIGALKNIDPLAYRLELLQDQPRARKVIETVARMANWERKREGRALGLAYSDFLGAHCAQIVEVSLNRDSGEIRVHKVWCCVDPGLIIQPVNAEAQIIGAITQGASHALFEQINLLNGEVQEDSFANYRVMRMSEAPEIEVQLLATPENPPTGLGEVGLPPTGPAIANAVARLTGGVRLRHYPFLPERVKAALNKS